MKHNNTSSPITFVIMVKNGEATIKKTLDQLRFWSQVLVVDTGSTDKTIEIAQSYPNIQLKQIPFSGFGKTRQEATNLAQTDWVFHLDADEVPSTNLLEELKYLELDNQSVYHVFRENYFLNKAMKGCSGWYPDWLVRLFNRKNARYSDDLVHEKVLHHYLDIVKLKGPILHTPYQNIKQMLDKMNQYSELFAESSSASCNLITPFVHAGFAFFKSYILKFGFKEGFRGLILSKYIADSSFYKYVKLYQKRSSK